MSGPSDPDPSLQHDAAEAKAEADADAKAKADEQAAAELLSPRRVLLTSGGFVVLLFVAVAIIGYFFRDPIQALSHAFIDVLGRPGIALGYFLPDAFTLPIPNDAFGWFGLEAGVPFWEVVMWGTGGSLLGGSVGYLIGKKLRKTRLVNRFLSGKGRGIEPAIRRYGVVVIAIAAVSPLPYSLSAWAAGATKMPFGTFFATSLLRVVRVAGALYLVQLGLLSLD